MTLLLLILLFGVGSIPILFGMMLIEMLVDICYLIWLFRS